jgi:hypothetical protein
MIARLEGDERDLTLFVAFACELIFGVEWHEIFPELFASMEECVAYRVHELMKQLGQPEGTKKTASKLELLRGALNRVASAPPHEI